MPSCSAYNCKNRPGTKIEGITFHHFPANAFRRQQWVLAVRRANWTPSKNSQLCSKHFEEHMFDRTSPVLTLLKKTAIPTIFDGYPPIANLELLTPKPADIYVKQEPFQCVEPFEDISNSKNRILVLPESLDVQATFCNGKEHSNGDKNIVIIKNEQDLKSILNCGNESDGDANRTIIVSDGTNIKTEWCGNVKDDSEELGPYDPLYGEESCKVDFVDPSKLKTLITYDPDFYVRKIKTLEERLKMLKSKKKVLLQKSRRRRGRIAALQKEVNRVKKNILPPSCTTHPVVHVIPQINNN